MKILWCDDKAADDDELRRLLDDWGLRPREKDILRATDDRTAMELLQSHPEIRLVILDLFWGEPEHPSVKPTGIHILERIRERFPRLRVVTRSVVEKPEVLSGFVRYFVNCRVSDHFVSHSKDPLTDLRKEVIIEMAERDEGGSEIPSNLSEFLGDQWA